MNRFISRSNKQNKEKLILETFAKVRSIKRTSELCEASRNTVRKIIRSAKDNEALKEHHEKLTTPEKHGPLTDNQVWNPENINLYKVLVDFKSRTPIAPHVQRTLDNSLDMMRHLGEEFDSGKSISSTIKFEMLCMEYLYYQKLIELRRYYTSESGPFKTPEMQARAVVSMNGSIAQSHRMILHLMDQFEGKDKGSDRYQFLQNKIELVLGENLGSYEDHLKTK